MPTVLRFDGYRAFFYSNEGAEPAHIHVAKGGREAKFWLHDLGMAVNIGFAPHEIINAILKHLRAYRAELIKAWHGHYRN